MSIAHCTCCPGTTVPALTDCDRFCGRCGDCLRCLGDENCSDNRTHVYCPGDTDQPATKEEPRDD